MTPTCPPNYSCTFTPKNLDPDPWWMGQGGTWAVIVGSIALAALLAYLAFLVYDNASARREEAAKERQRQYRLTLEEQRTMQLDAAKGSPEMFKLLEEQLRDERTRARLF